MLFAAAANSQDIGYNTFLIDVRMGSVRADLVKRETPSYLEFSQGRLFDLSKLYSPAYPDITMEFLTQINERFGVIWGVSTGEVADKFKIDPSFTLGFVHRVEIVKNLSFSTQVRFVLGGNLTESPCIGDYGAIGGLQTVNCRLAATALPPRDTLMYLFSEKGLNNTSISFRLEYYF